jgi:hypothetical protein
MLVKKETLNITNGGILIPTNATSTTSGVVNFTSGGAVKPTFQLATDASGALPTSTYRTVNTVASTYFMQFGLRYIFN